MWSLILSTFAWRILQDTIWLIWAPESRCASLSELFFFETFTKKDAVFQSRNLISATKLQLISRRCSSEAFVNISADAARRHRRTSISARPRRPPRRSAAVTLIKAAQPRRADGNVGKKTSRSSLTARRRRVNAARAAAIRDLIGFKIVNLRLGHFRLPRVTSHELALEQVGEHKIPKTR